MSKNNNYTVSQFFTDYPDDDACLEEIFRERFGNEITCKGCGEIGAKFYKVRKRKCYACSNCGWQIHPLAGTIFHKSSTSLQSWFFAMYLFSTAKNGVAAKELQRHTGVTYKTAWRMAYQIRLLMQQRGRVGGKDTILEADETYWGGKHRAYHRYKDKVPILGVVERNGEVRAVATDTPSVTRVRQFSLMR